jgi:hypothetical protein
MAQFHSYIFHGRCVAPVRLLSAQQLVTSETNERTWTKPGIQAAMYFHQNEAEIEFCPFYKTTTQTRNHPVHSSAFEFAASETRNTCTTGSVSSTSVLRYIYRGTAVTKCLRRYATSRKIVGSRPNEVNEFFNLPNPSGRTRPWGLLGQTEMNTRNRKIMFLGSRARPVRKANITAICEPPV